MLVVDRDPRRRVQVVEDVLRRYLHEATLHTALDESLRHGCGKVALPVYPQVLRRRLRALERYLRTGACHGQSVIAMPANCAATSRCEGRRGMMRACRRGDLRARHDCAPCEAV